jgi:hypothetical protein
VPSAWVTSLTRPRIRKKVTGRTKAEVRDKLRELHHEVGSGLLPRKRYTVSDALEDWLAHGVDGLSTRTLQIAHNVLVRAIRQAARDDLVGRGAAVEVADLGAGRGADVGG